MPAKIHVGPRTIGDHSPCFIIAEAGVNHNGDLDLAKKLVDAAADAGADAVKFQTFRADLLASASAPKAAYQERETGAGESQLEMLRRLELPAGAFKELSDHAAARNIMFLSTPFDPESAKDLASLGMPAIKVPSGELTNHPFVAELARFGLPMLVSTGMADLAEVHDALDAIRRAGDPPVALFHCTSNYPADPEDVNLRAMATMRAAFGVPVGYSDHTAGIEVSLAAAALGAQLIEKHFTLDQDLPGPDHKASITPAELTQLVQGVRTIERALGHGRKSPTRAELDTAAVARRSVLAARDLEEGHTLTASDLVIRRPGTGIPPKHFDLVIGRRVRTGVRAGTPLGWEMLA